LYYKECIGYFEESERLGSLNDDFFLMTHARALSLAGNEEVAMNLLQKYVDKYQNALGPLT